METARGDERWITVGCAENIIEASWQALWDSLELPILRDREGRPGSATRSGSKESDGAGPVNPAEPEYDSNKILTPLEA